MFFVINKKLTSHKFMLLTNVLLQNGFDSITQIKLRRVIIVYINSEGKSAKVKTENERGIRL